MKKASSSTSRLSKLSYKNDDLGDPLMCESHALALKLVTEEQLETVKKYAAIVNDTLKDFFLEKGLKLIDFKIEFGLYDGEVILADEISPDTCRLWDVKTGEKMDKDRFRREPRQRGRNLRRSAQESKERLVEEIMEDTKLTYKDAGVDTKEGERAVSLMKEHVKGTFNKNVLTGLGSFGSLFALDVADMKEPVLVSGTDGVGTKLKLAFLMDRA